MRARVVVSASIAIFAPPPNTLAGIFGTALFAETRLPAIVHQPSTRARPSTVRTIVFTAATSGQRRCELIGRPGGGCEGRLASAQCGAQACEHGGRRAYAPPRAPGGLRLPAPVARLRALRGPAPAAGRPRAPA